MTLLRCIGLLTVIVALAGGQAAARGKPPLSRPEALVSGLYEQVVARHPLGIPYGADKDAFAPYLSKGLLHRFDLNIACDADWHRQFPDPDLKPEIGIFEAGLFSGGEEKAAPTAFHIERTESRKDGSSRVYVRLTADIPQGKPLTWYVAAVVVREGGHLVLSDILHLKSKRGDVEFRLSDALSDGCDGGRWVGHSR